MKIFKKKNLNFKNKFEIPKLINSLDSIVLNILIQKKMILKVSSELMTYF